MTDRLNARIAISLLAVVVRFRAAVAVIREAPRQRRQRQQPPQRARPAATFTATVWPSMSSTCVVCHRAGAVASGTRLVFAAGASTEANYGVLRTFAAANGDLLMSKSIGLPTHSGGKPFVDANSQQYKDLASLLPKLKESCSTEVLATGQFWERRSVCG